MTIDLTTDLTAVATADLIAGKHISDVELFKCFSVEPPELGGEDLYSYRPVARYAVDEKKSLRDMMGNPGTPKVKKPAEGDELAVITMVKSGAGGDADFRSARVAQLEKFYAERSEDEEIVDFPNLQDFHAEYVV
jgi:hypothetical protein